MEVQKGIPVCAFFLNCYQRNHSGKALSLVLTVLLAKSASKASADIETAEISCRLCSKSSERRTPSFRMCSQSLRAQLYFYLETHFSCIRNLQDVCTDGRVVEELEYYGPQSQDFGSVLKREFSSNPKESQLMLTELNS